MTRLEPRPSLSPPPARRVSADWAFLACFGILGGLYVLLIVGMLWADVAYVYRDLAFPAPGWLERLVRPFASALASPEIRYATRLSLVSCSLTALLSVFTAIPLGYLMARYRFPGKKLVDALLDIPIVLPPLVIGLSLLLLFQTSPGLWLQGYLPLTYAVPGVVLAQYAVACSFAVRTMRVTFDHIGPRPEQVALTLGCGRARAFGMVALPMAWRGVVTAGTLAWARSLGEFGPILVFSGTTRLRTEVLPTSVYLELTVGNLERAVAVSLLMVAAAVLVLMVVRILGLDPAGGPGAG